MNIQRFTATGFNPNNRCAEVAADDHGAWVLHDDVADMQRDAERYRFCVERNTMPVIAGDGETWCMFVAVKSSRRSLFTGATPSEVIDAAMNGANA